MNKLKDALRALFREHGWLKWAAAVFVAILGYLVVDLGLHFGEDRALDVSKGQLVVEVLSLSALVVAFLQLLELSSKPRLRVVVQWRDVSGSWQWADEAIWMNHRQALETAPDPLLKTPREISHAYTFTFKVLIENSGPAAARFLKLTVELVGAENVNEILGHPLRLSQQHRGMPGGWHQDNTGLLQKYYGGDQLVVYSHPPHVTEIQPWLEQLAEFHLGVPLKVHDVVTCRLLLRCSLQADEFDLHVQEFQIRFDSKPTRKAPVG